MQTNYLLPHKYKKVGWILFILGIILGLFLVSDNYESDTLSIKVLSIFDTPFSDTKTSGYFRLIENDIINEIISLFIILGGLLVGFSKEKIEDEFIHKLRYESLAWAIILNYFILVFTIIFVYNLAFFDVLVFNMFTPLLFFIIRFNFLKLKSRSHEE